MQTSRGIEPPDAHQHREEQTAHHEVSRVDPDEPLPEAHRAKVAAVMMGIALPRGTPPLLALHAGVHPIACVGMETAPLRRPCRVKEEATVTAKNRHQFLHLQTPTAWAVRSAIRGRPR